MSAGFTLTGQWANAATNEQTHELQADICLSFSFIVLHKQTLVSCSLWNLISGSAVKSSIGKVFVIAAVASTQVPRNARKQKSQESAFVLHQVKYRASSNNIWMVFESLKSSSWQKPVEKWDDIVGLCSLQKAEATVRGHCTKKQHRKYTIPVKSDITISHKRDPNYV